MCQGTQVLNIRYPITNDIWHSCTLVPENRYPNTRSTRYPGRLAHLGVKYKSRWSHLCVDHGYGDPVIAPEQAALCSELTKFLGNALICNLHIKPDVLLQEVKIRITCFSSKTKILENSRNRKRIISVSLVCASE